MKRSLFFLLWGIIMNTTVVAGGRFVRVDYEHSRRAQHYLITIELGSENNNDRIFYGKFSSLDRGQKDAHPSNELLIGIDKEYFDIIYVKASDLNFKEIIKSSESIVGADGESISITVGSRQNNLKLSSWSPTYRSEERKTGDFCLLLSELFSLFDMEEWL